MLSSANVVIAATEVQNSRSEISPELALRDGLRFASSWFLLPRLFHLNSEFFLSECVSESGAPRRWYLEHHGAIESLV
jgi:hypothetical protein